MVRAYAALTALLALALAARGAIEPPAHALLPPFDYMPLVVWAFDDAPGLVDGTYLFIDPIFDAEMDIRLRGLALPVPHNASQSYCAQAPSAVGLLTPVEVLERSE